MIHHIIHLYKSFEVEMVNKTKYSDSNRESNKYNFSEPKSRLNTTTKKGEEIR